jgi:hypothetical protein
MMANVWQPYQCMNEQEFEVMAKVLEARHGQLAAQVAEFFAYLHVDMGDEDRSVAWADVAERVRDRERDRLQQA